MVLASIAVTKMRIIHFINKGELHGLMRKDNDSKFITQRKKIIVSLFQ